MTVTALAPSLAIPSLRVVTGRERHVSTAHRAPSWWERRAERREIVGGCPVHWWNPTAQTTAACTCDRF